MKGEVKGNNNIGIKKCATNPPTHPLLVDQNVQKFIEPLESGCTGGECWGWVGVPEPYPLSTSYPHGYQRNA